PEAPAQARAQHLAARGVGRAVASLDVEKGRGAARPVRRRISITARRLVSHGPVPHLSALGRRFGVQSLLHLSLSALAMVLPPDDRCDNGNATAPTPAHAALRPLNRATAGHSNPGR